MPREFIPTWSTDEQMLRDLCDHVQFPVPTALRVTADRADVQDEIRKAEDAGDPDRAAALKESNKDLLDDRETVLERLIQENRQAGEQGNQSAAQAAVRYQQELDEYRRLHDGDGADHVDEPVDEPTDQGEEVKS